MKQETTKAKEENATKAIVIAVIKALMMVMLRYSHCHTTIFLLHCLAICLQTAEETMCSAFAIL